jgi:hypothetical protein
MTSSIEQLLTKNSNRDNKNKKFPDSSPTSSVFSRLGYNFTPPEKYEKMFDTTPEVVRHLKAVPKLMTDWQAEDMRNSVVTDYFQNPLAGAIDSITNSLNFILDTTIVGTEQVDVGGEGSQFINVDIVVPGLEIVKEECEIALSELGKFKLHTDKMSNVVPISEGNSQDPHYLLASSIGKSLSYIVNQTDNIQNSAPILGSFTSLFIEDELYVLENIIIEYPDLIANSITITGGGGGEDPTPIVYSTDLTEQQINEILDNIKNVTNLISTRRRHDFNFFNNMKKITEEYSLFRSISESGLASKQLINEFIGTDSLKDKLRIPDNPDVVEKQVKVDLLGRQTIVNAITGEVIEEPTQRAAIEGVVETYNDLPIVGNVVCDAYRVRSTNERFVWNGQKWILVSGIDGNSKFSGTLNSAGELPLYNNEIGDYFIVTENGEQVSRYIWECRGWNNVGVKRESSPILTLDEFIEKYNANTLNVTFGVYEFELDTGALIFNTINGIWSNTRIVTVTNTGNVNYAFSSVTTSNFTNSQIQFKIEPENSNTINVGNSIDLIVSARSFAESNIVDYGVITIQPGITIQTKVNSNVNPNGILLPDSITQNVGSSTAKLKINEVNGPYRLLAAESEAPLFYTWTNESANSVTISTIEDITPNTHNTDMTIEFYQANTPNTLNTNDRVLWYANVTPHIEFPDSFVYRVSTTDGQERIITIGIDRGNVNDSNLYNEIVNSNPDIVVTNSAFSISVFDGKPNTRFIFTGPESDGNFLLDANGQFVIANNVITANGTYTYVFEFLGTGRRRTLTKAIFS